MPNQTIDEFLDLLSLTTEEQRTLQILIRLESGSFEDVSKDYEKKYSKVGNKLYHILNNLVKKEFVSKNGKKLFSVNQVKLNSAVKEQAELELVKAQKRLERIESSGTQSMRTYVGGEQVAELFKEIDKLESEGVEQYGITDILSYPVKTTLSKNEFIEQTLNTQKNLLKLRTQGKMRDYHICEKAKVEAHLKELEKDRGKKYLIETMKYISDSLETDNFQIAFADNVSFKFFVIPNKIAVISWFSSPDVKHLDRAIAFWYPDSIKSLEDYFWVEWKRTIGNKSEDENRKEVMIWTKEFLRKI